MSRVAACRRTCFFCLVLAGTFAYMVGIATAYAAETVFLSSLDLKKIAQGYGEAQADKSVMGKPISIGGQKFQRGLGTHADSVLYIDLHGGSERFTASVGVDDETGSPLASVVFRVVGDGRLLWRSGVMKCGDAPKKVDLDLTGVKNLILLVSDAGDGNNSDHADWADAKFTVVGQKPQATFAPRGEPVILTPKPPATPRINGRPGLRRPARPSVPVHDPGHGRAPDDVCCRSFARGLDG